MRQSEVYGIGSDVALGFIDLLTTHQEIFCFQTIEVKLPKTVESKIDKGSHCKRESLCHVLLTWSGSNPGNSTLSIHQESYKNNNSG